MKIFYGLPLSLLILFFFIMPITAQEKYESLIKGKVVDDMGQPVNRSHIRLDISEDIYPAICGAKDFSVASDINGNFVFEESCTLANRNVILYIIPRIGLNDLIAPIYPPFWTTLRRNNPRFSGLAVTIKANKNTDLGNVPIQVWYNKTELFVLNEKGKPYYKTDDDWANFQLIVRDETGDDVGHSSLSNFDIENKVNMEKGFVKMALPEGTWTLELLADLEDYDNETGKTKRFLAKTIVTIKKSEPTLPIRLIVKEN